MKKFIPVLILLTAPLVMCAEKYELTLDSGHVGQMHALAWDEGGGLLFTGGADGTLRIWRNEPFRLLRKIQVSDLPVRRIDLNPRAAEIALVQSDGNSRHVLTVLNWETGKRKFSTDLPEVPLVLEFSPLGNFIAVSKTDWKSLTFFDADDGKRLSYLQDGFGIVSFLMVSSSENTLVSYTPSSGTFVYWDLRPGSRKQTVRGAAELKNLTAYNTRYAAGTLGSELVVVDLVTGAVTASAREEGISRITVGPGGRLATLAARGGETFLQSWGFEAPGAGLSRGALIRTGGGAKSVPNGAADIVFAGERIFAALRDGSLGIVDDDFQPLRTAGGNRIKPVTDLIGEDGVLRLVTRDGIVSFASSFFGAAGGDGFRSADLSVSTRENPFGAPAGILKNPAGGHLLWLRDADSPGKIALVDSDAGAVLSRFDSFSLPLLTVREADGFLYCLEKNGSIRKIEAAGMRTAFEYPAWGILTMVPLGNRYILAGKSRSGIFASPLVSINAETGETAPVDAPPAMLVFAIEHDPRNNRIYYTGLENDRDGKTVTKLYSADLQRPGNAAGIAVSDSADIDADIHVDPDTSDLYTTLGNVLRKWDGSRWTNFEAANAWPVFIRDHGRHLFAINADGSVTAWEKKSGRLAGTIHLLDDGTWIAAAPTGAFLASHEPGKDLPLTALRGGVPLPEDEIAGLRLVPGDQP